MFSILRKVYLYVCGTYFFRYLASEIWLWWAGVVGVVEDVHFRHKNKFDPTTLSGKTAIVTGGARGIGSDVVKKLLQCDVHVIIGCRNIEAGSKSLNKIRESGITTGHCDIAKLDLASFSSIRSFVKEVHEKTDKLHLLVNNAGIMIPPFAETEDGYESQWCINYLGPFLLTHLLTPLISKTSLENECRIINVSSIAHGYCSKINYKDINNKSQYVANVSYSLTKAAQVLFTYHLSEIFKMRDLNISVFAVHPGIVNTDMLADVPARTILPWVFDYICKNSDQGATSVLYPCISQDLKGKSGLYLSNCRIVSSSKFSRNVAEQKELFSYSLKELKLNTFGLD